MSHLTDNVTVVVDNDQQIVPNAAATFSSEVDFHGCIGGLAQIEFQFATAPEANKSLDLFLLPGLGAGQAFDEFSTGRNLLLGLVQVDSSVEIQRLSILFPAIHAPYGKLALLNKQTGQIVTIKKLTVNVRRVG